MNVERPSTPAGALRFLSGPMAGKTIPLQKPVIAIGRDASNDIVLLDPKVSRHHVLLKWLNNTWVIENISQNTLSINQQRVLQGTLQHNNLVTLGEGSSFVFLEQVIAQPPIPGLPPTEEISPFGATPLSSEPIKPPPPPDHLAFDPGKTSLAPQLPSGTASLIVSSNVRSDKKAFPLTKPVISLGRDPSNDIVIPEPVVSGFHAQIIRDGNQYYLVHPHPTRGRTLNGLLFQGRIIRGDQPFRHQLSRGDIFRIGDEHGTLVTLTFHDGTSASQEKIPDIQPIPLGAPVLTIGRLPDNTVVLNHPQVSAHHARLEREQNGAYRLIDLNSTNHTYINNQAVTSYLLRTGDEIRIGPFRLTYTGTALTQYDESNHIRIDALNLKKVGNNQVILLNDISLVIPPRSFVALVGGSGAGKSTLMDALNGLRPAQEGRVLYNGQDYYRNFNAFKTQLGYVPQDDIVHRDLTVEHALYYAARLRLPRDFTSDQIKQRIDEVLEDVEMTERRSLLVSKLSGGQRKRVSIALELLANPSVFFLDEPTSGLDPGLDRKMMFLLRRLADRGRTIILVTHATNNINVCDYVCFLATGGRMAFFGPPEEAKVYFGKSDFAEIYSTLEATKEHPQAPQEAEARFRSSSEYQRYVAQPLMQNAQQTSENAVARQNGHTASPGIAASSTKKARAQRGTGISQFLLLCQRYLELLKNDRGNLLILLLQAPVIGLLSILTVRVEIGANVFATNKMMQCATQVLTSSGPLALPSAQQTATTNCSNVENFLRTSAQAVAYVQQQHGVMQALQNFILPGSGTDAQKTLFIIVFATVLFGCINGSREIVKEAAIYQRERAVNLGLLPYMFSKIVILSIFCLFQSAVLLAIVEIGEPLYNSVFLPPILEAYITLALTSIAGLMFGLTISALSPNNDRAMSLVPIILIPQVIFSGALIPIKDWPTQILASIFPTRWAMAALGTSIGLHDDKLGGDTLFGHDPTNHSTVFSIYSQQDAMHRLFLAWAALIAISVVLTIIIGICLKHKDIRR